MSLIRRGIESRASFPAYGQTFNPLNLLYGQTSVLSSAGERVDEVTALGVAAVFSAVSLLADSVASMPLRAIKFEADGSRKFVPVPVVLSDPDPAESNRYELMHMIVSSLALHGNAYCLISRDAGGNPISLLPLHPYQMNVLPDKNMSGRQYLHLGRPLPKEDVLHIRWMTSPQSLVGVSPLLHQRTMIGLAIAMDRFMSGFYSDGGTPSGVLSTEKPLSREAMVNLRESWEASTRKRRRPAVLADGLKWTQVQTSAVDMEFALTRDNVNQEIARVFRIPAHMLNMKSDSATYQNVEAASINFLTYTLQPWISRLEIAFSQKLLPPDVLVEFDTSSILRMDSMTKARVQLTQIQSGTRSRNEARAVDGLPPYPGGDDFVVALPGAPMSEENSVGKDDDPTTPPIDQPSPTDAARAAVELIESGFDPGDVLDVVGLPAMRHAPAAEPTGVDTRDIVDALKAAVSEIPAPVVNVTMPEPKPTKRTVKRDADGNITAIVEE